jgi:hypothetical protein
LAIVVIGGLITSTLLTLIVVPTFYGFFEGKSHRHRQGPHGDSSIPALAETLGDPQLQPVSRSELSKLLND